MTEVLPVIPHCQNTLVSLDIDADTTLEEFLEIGNTLIVPAVQVSEAMPWWLGSYVNFGEKRYGEKYAQALDSTHYKLDQLVRYAYTERNVPPENRIRGMSLSHHYVAARLPVEKQRKYLEVADREQMSSAALRKLLEVEEPTEETRGRPKKPKKTFSDWLEIFFKDKGYTQDPKDANNVHVSDVVIKLMEAAWEAK